LNAREPRERLQRFHGFPVGGQQQAGFQGAIRVKRIRIAREPCNGDFPEVFVALCVTSLNEDWSG
jgi:hypothetical protein